MNGSFDSVRRDVRFAVTLVIAFALIGAPLTARADRRGDDHSHGRPAPRGDDRGGHHGGGGGALLGGALLGLGVGAVLGGALRPGYAAPPPVYYPPPPPGYAPPPPGAYYPY